MAGAAQVPPVVQSLFAAWGWQSSPAVTRAFARYVQELLTWNRRLNLTAWRRAEEIWLHLIADSLALSALRAHLLRGVWADVGSGAGIPGIPLHLARPQVPFTLIEAARKKARFLEHVRAVLDAPGLTIVARRAEEVGQDPAHRERYDGVVARAVAPLPTLLEYTLPLVRPSGWFVAYKGPRVHAEIAAAARALALLGGRVHEVVAVPALPYERYLVLIEKTTPTPTAYPRRPGRARKHPL